MSEHLAATLDGFEKSVWMLEPRQVDCTFNQAVRDIPRNHPGQERDEFNIRNVQGFLEWADRQSCQAVCDGSLVLDCEGEDGGVLFSISFLYSKSVFFRKEGEWRMRRDQELRPQVFVTHVDRSITTDRKVLEVVIFWAYTGLLLDISTLTDGTCCPDKLSSLPNQHAMVWNPAGEVDLYEVFKLASHLEIQGLTKSLVQHCFKPSPSCSFGLMEHRLAGLLARCEIDDEAGEGELFDKVAETYVAFTGGLACLCHWPLFYSEKKWSMLMAAGKKVAHHWFAHVVPLYVHMFLDDSLKAKAIVEWSSGLGLMEAAEQSVGLSVAVSFFS